MSVLCHAVGDVVAVCVVLSVARSVFCFGCGRYSESMVTRRW